MKLWTIQSEIQWQNLQKNKILLADNSGEMAKEYSFAYEWLIKQMNFRIKGKLENANYPIWCWHSWQNSIKQKPDLRFNGFVNKGEKAVLIEFHADKENVLLFDFELWHLVLYKSPISNNKYFNKKIHKLIIKYGYDNLKQDLKLEIEKSWEKIFNLDWEDEYWTHKKGFKSIQGTLWCIKIEDVVNIKKFIGK